MTDAEMAKRAHLAGAFRALDLKTRMPAYFSRRGWPWDEHLLAVAQAAVCSVALGAWAQRFRLPRQAEDLPAWEPLVKLGKPMAAEIVALLDLRGMLDP